MSPILQLIHVTTHQCRKISWHQGDVQRWVIVTGDDCNRRHAIETAKEQWRRFLLDAPDYPAGQFEGRGVVILAGSLQYMVPAWVNVVSLRRAGVQIFISSSVHLSVHSLHAFQSRRPHVPQQNFVHSPPPCPILPLPPPD